MNQPGLQSLRDLEAAMSMELEREEERMCCEKGRARAAKRAAKVGEVAPLKRQRFDRLGRSRVTNESDGMLDMLERATKRSS